MSDPRSVSPVEGPGSARAEARVESFVERYGGGGDASVPTAAQWRRLLEAPSGDPITLINFFKLRDAARYGASDAVDDPAATGAEAMMRYAAVSGPALERVGGRFLLMGPFEASVMGEEEDWDLVAIGSYPSHEALFALFEDAAYAAAYGHRRAAVERQRVMAVRG